MIPRYCFGIEPSLEFGEKYRVTPELSLLGESSSITVPLKHGTLSVAYKNGYLSVYADQEDGEVVINGQTIILKKGEKYYEKA